MFTLALRAIASLLLPLCLFGCSGLNAGDKTDCDTVDDCLSANLCVNKKCVPQSSGLDGSAGVGSLAQGDRERLCIWAGNIRGGEKQSATCGTTVVVTGTLEECLYEMGNYKDCSLTVAELEKCVVAMGSETCTGRTVFDTSEECQPVRQCSPDNISAPTPESFVSEHHRIACKVIYTCCSSTEVHLYRDYLGDTEEKCRETLFTPNFSYTTVDRLVKEGKTTYSQVEAERCLAKLAQTKCEPGALTRLVWSRWWDFCPNVVSGTIPAGQPCSETEACIGPASCGGIGGGPYICISQKKAGQTCNDGWQLDGNQVKEDPMGHCASGLYCDVMPPGDKTCHYQKQLGSSCLSNYEYQLGPGTVRSAAHECALGLSCVGGKCVEDSNKLPPFGACVAPSR